MLTTKNFSDLVVFSRPTTGFRFGSDGLPVSTPAGMPRMDYDPLTLAWRGVLLGDQEVNYLYPSMCATNATYYTVTDAPMSLVPGQQSRRYVAKGNGSPPLNPPQGFQFTSTGAMCSFMIIETDPASAPNAKTRLIFYRVSGTPVVWSGMSLDLATGVAVPASGAGPGSSAAIKLANVGPNGGVVWLLWINTTNPTGETLNCYPYPISDTIAEGQSVFVHHLQMSAGVYPGSIIPTTTAQGTRAADSATITDLSKIAFNPREGAIIVDFIVPRLSAGLGADPAQGVFGFVGSYPNYLFGVGVGPTGKVQLYRTINGANLASLITSNAVTPGSIARLGVAWSATKGDAICLNGGPVVAGSGTDLTGMTDLRLGRFASNPGYLNGWLRNIGGIPYRPDDVLFQARCTL